MVFDNKLNGHNFLGQVDFETGKVHVHDQLHVSGEIYQSGSLLEVTQINSVVITGTVVSAFSEKGELLVGSGALQSTTLPLGTHGQLLQVDTTAGGGDHGMKWVDSGIFTGPAPNGLSLFLEKNLSLDTIAFYPDTGTKHAGILTNRSFFVGGEGSTDSPQGLYAVAIMPSSSINAASVKGNYSVVVGGSSSTTTGNYTVALGRSNAIDGGDYNEAIGHQNLIGAYSSDYSFVGGYQNYTSGRGDVMLGMHNEVVSTDGWEQYEASINSHVIQVGSGNLTEMVFEAASDPNDFGLTGLFAKNIQLGTENVANAANIIQIGNINTAGENSSDTISIGQRNTGQISAIMFGNDTDCNTNVGTDRPIAIGDRNIINFDHICLGHGNQGSTHNKGVIIGYDGTATRYGEITKSVGATYEGSELIFGGDTTDATATEVFLGGESNKRFTIAIDSTVAFSFITVARRTDVDGESAAYKHEGVVRNDAGVTSVVGSISNTALAEDTAAWDATMAADDTNDSVKLTVQGEASKNISWRTYGFVVEISG